MEYGQSFVNAASLFDVSECHHAFLAHDAINEKVIDVISGASQVELEFKQWVTRTRASHPGHAIESSLEDRLDILADTIEQYIADDFHLCIGLSGKDSLCLLANIVNILLVRKRQGFPNVRLDVFTSDTKIDSVLMTNVIKELSSALQRFAQEHDLDIHYHRAQPALSSDYLVGILGGRTLPTTAANRSRKCAVDLKVNVIKRVQRKIIKENAQVNKKTLMLLGKYYLESADRERRMVENEEGLLPKLINGQLVASPMCFWSIYDVFEFLHRATPYNVVNQKSISGPVSVFADFENIKQAYTDMSGGCTLSIINEGKAALKPCDARSGCHQCLAVGRDKSAENLISQHSYLEPLNRIRNYLATHHNNPSKRAWMTRKLDRKSNGDYYVTLRPDTYSIEHCTELLKFYATAHFNEIEQAAELNIEPRFSVLDLEQIIAIGLFQERYGMTSGWTALSIYDQVANQHEFRVLPKKDDCEVRFTENIRPNKVLSDSGLSTPLVKLNRRFSTSLESEFMGTRDILEATTETEKLLSTKKGSVRSVDVSESGEFAIDIDSEPWLIEQELFHHIDNYRKALRAGHNYPSLFHVLTRLGVLSFNNKGAASRWNNMRRTGAITSIIHAVDASNPHVVAAMLT